MIQIENYQMNFCIEIRNIATTGIWNFKVGAKVRLK